MGQVAAGIMQARTQADGLGGRLKTANAREARNKKHKDSREGEFDSIGRRMYRQAPGRCDVLQVVQYQSAAPTPGGSENHVWLH